MADYHDVGMSFPLFLINEGRCYGHFPFVRPESPLKVIDRGRPAQGFAQAPRVVDQSLCRSGSLIVQRAMGTDPVVPVAPHPQRPLQAASALREILRAAREPRLLAAQRAVEPFDMSRVNRLADPQVLNAGDRGTLRTKQTTAGIIVATFLSSQIAEDL